MNIEAIYARLPILIQQVAVSLEGWRTVRSRYAPEFHRLLHECTARGRISQEEAFTLRDARLAAFVTFAAAHVPYYRELFARLGIEPRDICGLADLEALPVLTKADVQPEPSRFIPDTPQGRTIITHTSGSTGAGLRFPVTLSAYREQWAFWWRYRMAHGITLDEPCLYFGGRSVVPLSQHRPPYWRYNRPGRQLLFSGYHLGPDTASDYLDAMERSGFRWMHGYPSMLALIAGYALERQRTIGMQWVTIGAESLLPHQVEIIQQAFGVKPLGHYGLAEGAANISMCPERRFHIDEDFAAVECLPLNDGIYRLVGTNFTNYAFPLLRYDTGDTATLSSDSCPCGRPGRVVASIDGRREDYLITRDGRKLGRLDHVFKDMVHIREAQLRQSRAGEATVLIVRAPGYSTADEHMLREEMLKRVGTEIAFTIEYVDAIPRTRSGKLRFVVSTIDEGVISKP